MEAHVPRLKSFLASSPAARMLLLVLLFLLLTIAMTYPLVLYAGQALPGAPGDNFEYLFKLRLFADLLQRGQAWPPAAAGIFYPFGYDLRFADMTPINLALGLPVTLALNETYAYDFVALVSFVLSGLSAYLLARLVTRQQAPALVAGLFYAFSTYRMYRLGVGHLNQLPTGWIPLVFLYAELAIRQRRVRPAALAALAFSLTALSSWNYAYVVGLGLLIFGAVRTWPWRQTLSDRRLWRAVGAFVLLSAAILALPALAMLARRHGAGLSFSLADADAFSGDLLALLARNPASVFSPSSVLRPSVIPPIGWLALLLVLFSLRRRLSPAAKSFGVLLLVAVIMTWGLTLHWDGQRVYLAAPQIMENAFVRIMTLLTERLALNPQRLGPLLQPGTLFLPLPVYALFLFLPFFSALREWATFVALLSPAVAVLAAWTLAAVRGRWRAVILAVITVLALVELAPVPFAYGYSQTFTQPLVQWLREQPDSGVVARFPIATWTTGAGMYDAYLSGHPVTDGYAAFQPSGWRAAYPVLDRFPSAGTLQLLHQWQVRYIVVSPAAYGASWPSVERQIAATSDLCQVATVPYLSRFRSARLTPAGPAHPGDYVPIVEWMPSPPGTVLDSLRIYDMQQCP